MAHIVRFYAPRASSLLDITYGKGTLVRALKNIEITGIDLAPLPIAGHCVVTSDFRGDDCPLGTWDVGLYDPPYLYGRTSEVLYQRSDEDWKKQHTNAFTPSDFEELAVSASMVLGKRCPLAVVKVMNSRLKGLYVDNASIVSTAFLNNGWMLRDQIVYARLGVGVFRNTKTAQVAHGFYLIFSKKEVPAQ